MVMNLYFHETPMYFRHIYHLIIIMLWGVSQGKLSMLLKFGREIWSIKGVHQNGFFFFILVGLNVWMVII